MLSIVIQFFPTNHVRNLTENKRWQLTIHMFDQSRQPRITQHSQIAKSLTPLIHFTELLSAAQHPRQH